MCREANSRRRAMQREYSRRLRGCMMTHRFMSSADHHGGVMQSRRASLILLLALATGCCTALAQNVKITPLGTHPGELCDRDRATIFEDPTGVRILYDAGQSVMGGEDPRLGTIHVVLLSHAHTDHIGDRKIAALNAGSCEKPETVSALPNSTTAEIAAVKNASLIMIRNMAFFLGKKIQNIRGKPTGNCVETGGNIAAAQEAPCLAPVE